MASKTVHSPLGRPISNSAASETQPLSSSPCAPTFSPSSVRSAKMFIEPVESILLHFEIKLVSAGVEVATVHFGRAPFFECLTQHEIRAPHLGHGVQRIFVAVKHHGGSRRSERQDLWEVQITRQERHIRHP